MSVAKVESPQQAGPVQALLKGRWAVWLFIGLAFLIAISSVAFYLFQAWMSDPTGAKYRDQQGAWLQMASHLTRAVMAGWVMLRAWQYLRELKAARHSDLSDYRSLFAAIAHGLNAVGWSCLVLLSLGVLSIIDSMYGLPSIPFPGQHDKMRPFAPQAKREVKVEFREAQFEPREGWIEGFMTVIEPVKKPLYLRDSVIVDQNDITEAKATVDSSGSPAVAFTLSKSGAEKMLAWSTSQVDKHMAIIVDDVVLQAPIVRSPVSGSIMMTGQMSARRAQEIAASINGK